MASQQTASTKPFSAFGHIPVAMEIWGEIAQNMSTNSLSSFVLSSLKIYKSANPYLYRTVHFFGTARTCGKKQEKNS
jgi:hypothetical protein